MKREILGVKIDDLNMEEALGMVEGWLGKSEKHYIVTPNPEMLVEAQKNPEFKEILNKADLAIPDGAGLKLAGINNRVAGVDFMEQLVNLAAEKGWTVGFLGGQEGVAELAVSKLKQASPSLKVSFITHDTNYIIPATDILLVALGHVKQEKWIAENLPQIPVKVAMGEGGSFDYISGKVPRAPKWLRSIGLEWLFRLIIQPWRIKRQIALIRYLWLTLTS